MSKRDYLRAAEIIRRATYLDEDAREQLALDLIEWFERDNPRFRPDLFFAAAVGEYSRRFPARLSA